jgi:hypothetical protein
MRLFLCVLVSSFISFYGRSQDCNAIQNLSASQEAQLALIIDQLELELENEDLHKIDSLNEVLKSILGDQAGLPESLEQFRPLSEETAWISETIALELSRQLISNDSLAYVNLWKLALGQKPPTYQPHSIFLRTAAEFGSGLLKIANNETDLVRKNLYRTWAKQTFDSLLTKQLPNGAFPFPDLRTYNDPTFSSIIQNFLNSCGPDSVNVLQNGWIIDDKETGEFKFDAGIIANSLYEAYYFLNDQHYKDAVISIGNYLKNLKFNTNYNYNSFSVLGLVRAFQLSNDVSYLNRAIENLRFSISPGQINKGRWLDGHNASSRYHSIIIQNTAAISSLIPENHPNKNAIDSMYFLASKNILEQTYTCGSSTSFNWLMENYLHPNLLFTANFKDSITVLIGKQINQTLAQGDYLDVSLIGDYLELLHHSANLEDKFKKHPFLVSPNPFSETMLIQNFENQSLEIQITDLLGNIVFEQKHNSNPITLNLSSLKSGNYLLVLKHKDESFFQKIIKFYPPLSYA